jgi:hypothetical protein
MFAAINDIGKNTAENQEVRKGLQYGINPGWCPVFV